MGGNTGPLYLSRYMIVTDYGMKRRIQITEVGKEATVRWEGASYSRLFLFGASLHSVICYFITELQAVRQVEQANVEIMCVFAVGE